MSLQRVIAFSGKAGSGKTTSARFIAGRMPIYVVESLATPIKELALRDFGHVLTADDLKYHKDKVIQLGTNRMTVRELLIEIGRMYRAIDSGFWARKFMEKVDSHLRAGRNVVMDDMRMVDEYHLLKDIGATLVRIERPGIPVINDPTEWSLDEHHFDIRIQNDAGIPDLYEKLGCLMP